MFLLDGLVMGLLQCICRGQVKASVCIDGVALACSSVVAYALMIRRRRHTRQAQARMQRQPARVQTRAPVRRRLIVQQVRPMRRRQPRHWQVLQRSPWESRLRRSELNQAPRPVLWEPRRLRAAPMGRARRWRRRRLRLRAQRRQRAAHRGPPRQRRRCQLGQDRLRQRPRQSVSFCTCSNAASMTVRCAHWPALVAKGYWLHGRLHLRSPRRIECQMPLDCLGYMPGVTLEQPCLK